jgi:hypothetical protein
MIDPAGNIEIHRDVRNRKLIGNETTCQLRERLCDERRYRKWLRRLKELQEEKGISRDEAMLLAYRDFLPLKTGNVELKVGEGGIPDPEVEKQYRGLNAARWMGTMKLPVGWDKLPQNAELGAEVRWVGANLGCCKRRSGKPGVILGKAKSVAPSVSAVVMLESAVSNPNKFMLDVYPKVVKASEETAKDQEDEERLSIQEIQRILESLVLHEGKVEA